jgi:hypothetical protein
VTVRTVTWVARRVAAEQLEPLRAMAVALGLEVLAASTAQLTLRTDRGDVIEYCGPDHPVPKHLFAHGDTVLGFEVDDLEADAAALERAGVRSLTGTIQTGTVRFRHFLGPDGGVYGLIAQA